MRFSTLQDDVCGVGLPQDRLPNDIDENMMAVTGDLIPEYDQSAEDGSMVSNLPLLFANGYPTSLEKITLTQLERFITFMVHCSLGHDTAEVISEPQWWPKEVTFSNPLVRPKKINDNWMANLKKLVFRCYTYHRSEYLLRFCSYLARYPHEELEYVNNWDSTTSLYHKSSGKLLVTFRNENMNYDKKNDSPRKKLLVHNGVTSTFTNKSKQLQHSLMMVQPPCEDIYLCDNCDAEFVGLERMKEHERICCEQEQCNTESRPVTPEAVSAEPELGQNQFLEYFKLFSKSNNNLPVEKSSNIIVSSSCNNNVARRTSNRVRGSVNFARTSTIPFSSPAGIILSKKSKTMTEDTQQERLERIERHVLAPPLTDSCRPKWMDKEVERDRWVITHKPNRDKLMDDYVHQYKFRPLSEKPMLSIRSQLLYIACRPPYVVLARLNKNQIEELKQDPSKYQCTAIRKRVRAGPASKTKPGRNLSVKRKVPGDTIDHILVNEKATTMKITAKNSDYTDSVQSSTTDKEMNEFKSETETIHTKSRTGITIIDLCSSDEEEEVNTRGLSDENRDPLNITDCGVTSTLLQKVTSNNYCSKPCIYPENSTCDWLADTVLSNDSENSTNTCRSGVVLNTHVSPILRPAP